MRSRFGFDEILMNGAFVEGIVFDIKDSLLVPPGVGNNPNHGPGSDSMAILGDDEVLVGGVASPHEDPIAPSKV